MEFFDDSLLPECQEKLVIVAAPYGPQYAPGDSNDIPVSMADQVQKAVDCYNAGATVLHIHVREADGKGSKRLSMFNEMLHRLRDAVPDMLLQVGGSISFAPENETDGAKWLDYDTRHMLAELDPQPDQVTIAINSSSMNIFELKNTGDLDGTQLANPKAELMYRDMVVDATPTFYLEHLKRLQAKRIQPEFMLGNVPQLEATLRLIRKGHYMGPLVLTYVAIGGGASGAHPGDMLEFVRRTPQGAVLTLESGMRNSLPMVTMAMALGLHARVGIEDNLWGRKGERNTSVQQIERVVRIARELGRDVANGKEAKQIYKIGEWYSSTDETLAKLGMAPNRKPGQRGFLLPEAA